MDGIVVLDFGGQYAHLIGRRIRGKKVYSQVVPHDISFERLRNQKRDYKIKGIILSGGPSSDYEEEAQRLTRKF